MVPKSYDVIIRDGMIYDGSGGAPVPGDVAIRGDRIAGVGDLGRCAAKREVDAHGLAVAPGFINMLSWAVISLIQDGRSQSDIRQGVTLEVVGEGSSMGPLNDDMKRKMAERQGDIKYKVEWNTLDEYLRYMERRGISCNLASYVGHGSLRVHEIGYDDRPPSPAELDRMKALARTAMREGAVGMSSALIYAPECFAKTDELIELCKVVAEYDGLHVSHVRSEGDQFLEALEEFLTIAREARIRSEIYHLKSSGQVNWPKTGQAIARVEKARAEGLAVTADMYTYTASGTGLSVTMPPWVQEGGFEAWVARLKNPAIRERVKREMNVASADWENMRLRVGSDDRILLSGFKSEALKPLAGKTLAQVAAMRGTSPEDAIIDLIIEDDSRVEAIYFSMSEENVRKQIAVPWVCFGSDAGSPSAEGVFLKSNCHPRAYGTFARLLGKYVRDEKIIPLEEAVRKLTSLPAQTLRIKDRGRLAEGYYADLAVFDPATIQDHATFEKPHQYATGMVHVFVNGGHVLKDGEHTGANPGRIVRPG